MAISAEVLNTTYRQLKGPLIDTFMRRTPFLDTLFKNNRVRQKIDGGTTIDRAIMSGSPAKGKGIYSGTELLSLTRTKRTDQLSVEPHRLAAAIAIPNRELAQNSGPLAVMRLIEKYPESFMKSLDRCLESFFLSGAGPGSQHAFNTASLSGFLTLNGGFTGGTLTGATDGLLDFTTPALQTQTVQNLVKDEAKSYYNQWGDVTGWTTDGLQVIGSTIRRCGHYSIEGRPTLGFMDPDTMTNLEESKRGHVRVGMVDDKQEKTDLHTIFHNGVTFHESLDMDRTRAVFAAQPLVNGGGYILNPEYFEFSVLEEAELTDFIDMIAEQDVVVSKFKFHANLICRNPIAQGCFSGSAL
tara:strand:- start:2 stop:1066 length:1065 start_codon:yes stop_codon:yes gene_type:complete